MSFTGRSADGGCLSKHCSCVFIFPFLLSCFECVKQEKYLFISPIQPCWTGLDIVHQHGDITDPACPLSFSCVLLFSHLLHQQTLRPVEPKTKFTHSFVDPANSVILIQGLSHASTHSLYRETAARVKVQLLPRVLWRSCSSFPLLNVCRRQ